MNTGFSGKVVLIAGGTGGLGKAVSRAFLEEEASVIVTYRNPAEFAALEAPVRVTLRCGTSSITVLPERVEILKSDIKERRMSKVSPMPEGLANNLNEDEILDLVAYLQSGGKKEAANFQH